MLANRLSINQLAVYAGNTQLAYASKVLFRPTRLRFYTLSI